MKAFSLLVYIGIYCSMLCLAIPPLSYGDINLIVSNPGPEPKLELVTAIIDARYCRDGIFTTLVLTLRLSFTNTGTAPILLDKNSSKIGRQMVSKSVQDATARKYEYDAIGSSFDLRELGIRLDSLPEPAFFVTLEPGQSYSTTSSVYLGVHNGSNDTADDLHPGRRFLQVFVYTWYFIAPPNEYPDQWWKTKGYLWSQGIRSNPMPLVIEKHPKVASCYK